MQLEIFLQTLHSYFANSPKKHLQFTKLVEFMETKENKIFQNVKTRWILMFNLTKCSLFFKMALDSPTNQQTELNFWMFFEFFLDLLIFFLSWNPCMLALNLHK
jgi:hypothetical protein